MEALRRHYGKNSYKTRKILLDKTRENLLDFLLIGEVRNFGRPIFRNLKISNVSFILFFYLQNCLIFF